MYTRNRCAEGAETGFHCGKQTKIECFRLAVFQCFYADVVQAEIVYLTCKSCRLAVWFFNAVLTLWLTAVLPRTIFLSWF